MGVIHFHPLYRHELKKYFKGTEDPYKNGPYSFYRGAISLKQPPYDFPAEPLGRLRSDFIELKDSDNAAVKSEQKKLEERVNVLIGQLNMPRTA